MRSHPSMSAAPIGMLNLGDTFLVAEIKESSGEIWVQLDQVRTRFTGRDFYLTSYERPKEFFKGGGGGHNKLKHFFLILGEKSLFL